mmetsp:Transcript_6130/g.5532  ORF Transcript_6130/g.5532 Transcript_6130/m.5532 type:complete len:110 (+) Transcript_6130:132-461(+)
MSHFTRQFLALTDTETSLALPGETCSEDSDCYSDLCNSFGICDGVSLGGQCTSNDDCDVGLYCNNVTGVCDAQIQVGDSCGDTEVCVNWAMCLNNTCTQKSSINYTEII